MGLTHSERWEKARLELLDRWGRILEGIDARDEGRVMALSNVMDEFCEAAIVDRQAVAGKKTDPAVPILRFPAGDAVSGRCVFCRGFSELGGCFGLLHELNQAVLNGRWQAARRVAEAYIGKLRTLRVEPPAEQPRIH